jgi:hypothetical protein
MNVEQITELLKQHSNMKYLDGMNRFGVDNSKA